MRCGMCLQIACHRDQNALRNESARKQRKNYRGAEPIMIYINYNDLQYCTALVVMNTIPKFTPPVLAARHRSKSLWQGPC